MHSTGIRKAILLSMFQRYAAFAISFISSMVLARLLTPKEVGIFSLAAAVAAFAHLLRDFGVGAYLIQEAHLTRDKVRSAFGVTLIMGWTLGLTLLLIGGPMATFYHETGLVSILRVLALNFFLLPLGSVTFAILTKELAFGTLFYVQTISAISSAAVAIALASWGSSYMSLAWGSFAGIATTVAIFAVTRPSEIFMLPKFSGLGRAGKFGGLLTFTSFIDDMQRRAPDFVVGRLVGFDALGLFSKGYGLIESFNDLLTSGIARVVSPIFASRERTQNVLKEAFLHTASLYSIFPLGFFLFTAVFSKPLILALFGPQWLESAVLAQVFGLGHTLMSPYLLAVPFLVSIGRVKELLRVCALRAPIAVVGLCIGVAFGLTGAAVGLEVAGLLGVTILQRTLRQTAGIGYPDMCRVLKTSGMVVLPSVATAAPALMLYSDSQVSAVFAVTVGLTVTVVMAVVLVLRLHHPLSREFCLIAQQLRALASKSSLR